MEIKKAKSQQQKQFRVNTILNAAESLFSESHNDFPSAIEIAKKAGIAKGSLYNYFTTKEAIFLALQERHMQNWFDDIEKSLRQYEGVTVEDICQYLIQYWQQTPFIGQLVRMSDALLEPKVDDKDYTAYQMKLANDIKRLTTSFKDLNPDLAGSEWSTLLHRSIKLITLAWAESSPRKVNGLNAAPAFVQCATELLTPFWQQAIEFKKQKPKEKSTWRKLLGN